MAIKLSSITNFILTTAVLPLANGIATVGTSLQAAKADHVHPYSGRLTILDHSGVSNTVNITNGTLSILSRSLVTNSVSIGAL